MGRRISYLVVYKFKFGIGIGCQIKEIVPPSGEINQDLRKLALSQGRANLKWYHDKKR